MHGVTYSRPGAIKAHLGVPIYYWWTEIGIYAMQFNDTAYAESKYLRGNPLGARHIKRKQRKKLSNILRMLSSLQTRHADPGDDGCNGSGDSSPYRLPQPR